MKIEIKNRFTDNIIIVGEYESIKDSLIKNRGANLYGADLRGANLRGADLREANLYEADLRGANLRGADLRGADLRGADLRGANLRGADLRGADLRGANLRGADLRGADLRGADLYGANLYGADLYGAKIKLPIISIAGSMHFFFYQSGNITIGCESHSIEYWLIMYNIIGREYDYTPEQIREYGEYIKMCKRFI
jgi:uncharacterized protein YjbI with pentapeptide repeats